MTSKPDPFDTFIDAVFAELSEPYEPEIHSVTDLTEAIGLSLDMVGTPENYQVYGFPDLGEVWVRNGDKAFRINVAEIKVSAFEGMVADLDGEL